MGQLSSFAQRPSIAIAGAGIAGLSLAQALVRAGMDVAVYERDSSTQARRQGYRLTIDEHGAAALRSCLPPRLFETVLATASSPGDVGYFRFTNQNLGEIFKLTFRHSQTGERMIGQVDRTTLRIIMLSGIEKRVHFGKTAVRLETAAGEAVLHFTDGTSTRASVVVGADGIHSALRGQLLPDCPIVDTGARAIYGKTPLVKNGKSLLPESLETSGVWAVGDAPGRGFFFTTMRFNQPPGQVFERLVPDQEPPVSGDYIMWAMLFSAAELPAGVTELGSDALHRLAMEAVAAYHPLLRRFVVNAEPEYTVATTVSAAKKPQRWPASRATLIGDAVHAMPPTGAHGGNTALRDSATLAEELRNAVAGTVSPEEAIGRYQTRMLDYAFREVASSVAMLNRSNIKNPLGRLLMLRAIPWLRSRAGRPLVTER